MAPNYAAIDVWSEGGGMVSWARSRRARMERIEVEAETLIRDFGQGAYHEARRREHEASSDAIAEDWALVARAVARQTGSRIGLNISTQLEMNTFFVLDPSRARRAILPPSRIRGPNISRTETASQVRSRSGSSISARRPIPDNRCCGKSRSAPPMSRPRSSPLRSRRGRRRRSRCASSIARATRCSGARKAFAGCRTPVEATLEHFPTYAAAAVSRSRTS
jgi:hypothetical protein